MVDAVDGDDLVEEVEVASVDGFGELAEGGLGGFFAHCDLSLRCYSKVADLLGVRKLVAGKFLDQNLPQHTPPGDARIRTHPARGFSVLLAGRDYVTLSVAMCTYSTV